MVYEVNARVMLRELSTSHQKKLTLATLPDALLDEWADLGFDAIWLMGVWTTGAIGLSLARGLNFLREEYRRALPDVTDEDIIGSPYAVKAYTVSRTLGGNTALMLLRKRLARRGIGLFLDFVCNHTARDCRWVHDHPEYYIQGMRGDDQAMPDAYFSTQTTKGTRVIAFGKDPNYPGWTDTAQINFAERSARGALIAALARIAELCDGVRCDMAMLALNDVFNRTWGEKVRAMAGEPLQSEFWSEAIAHVKRRHPYFVMMGEAYWNTEWQLQQLGFDYTYDKVLYERLLREGAFSVAGHLRAEMDYQRKSVRFIENHDEVRAATALPDPAWHFAAAVVAATVPGMFLLHDGQLEGRKVKLPVQLGRRPEESPSPATLSFYRKLLSCLRSAAITEGEWRLLNIRRAWHDNSTSDNFLASWWHGRGCDQMIVVNYAPQSGQCYVEFSEDLLPSTGGGIEFRDQMGTATYIRDRSTLVSKGMYFDLPPYGFHFFRVSPTSQSRR